MSTPVTSASTGAETESARDGHRTNETTALPKACERLGIPPSTGYMLLKQDRFPCKVIRVGRNVRVVTASLDRLLAG